jgi:hypothetical protein
MHVLLSTSVTSISPYGVTSQATLSSHKIWVKSPQATNKTRANPWSDVTNPQHRGTYQWQPVWLPDCRAGAITAGWVGSQLNRLPVVSSPDQWVSVVPLSVTELSFYCALFCVSMAHVRYSLEQRVFIYDYVKNNNLYKSCRRIFHSKYPHTCPSGHTISILTKKVQNYGILIDRKP